MIPPILVACPTRDRPDRFRAMCDSVFETSTNAGVVAWVDDDQMDLYPNDDRVLFLAGPRIGPIAAVNRIVQEFDAEVYGMVPDDAVFKTPGWDQWLLSIIAGFPKRIGVVAAAHNNSDFINFPWLTREWIRTVGYFYYPENFHHCADTVVELLGDPTSIVYADPKDFYISHDASPTVNQNHWQHDVTEFARWCSRDRRKMLARIREAIA